MRAVASRAPAEPWVAVGVERQPAPGAGGGRRWAANGVPRPRRSATACAAT